ncbi:hypothetical protein [Pseudomonas sp. BN102]|uniref:hypothetical protein n=1 Tax=Pseudomonas sp. BN102 TaxID=2567886 RepID=UPI002458572E|nr:hypothetical protein [Pseudomonas sp. BN102]MDH4609826.1 hypothetical protein [Pseudomonas sp. BN102]
MMKALLHAFWACAVGTLLPGFAQATPWPFLVFEDDFHVLEGSELQIENMPRTTNQQGFGNCFAHSAAMIFNFYACRSHGIDCPSAPTGLLASTLDMTRFGSMPDGEPDYPSSYSRIDEGGSGALALHISTVLVGTVASEACFPSQTLYKDMVATDQTLTQDQLLMQRNNLERLKEFYEAYRGIVPPCADCPLDDVGPVLEFSQLSNAQPTAEQLYRALGEASFGAFLERAIFPEPCSETEGRAHFEFKDSMVFNFYPRAEKQRNYASVMAAIKKSIRANNPVLLQNVCVKEEGESCFKGDENGHSVVIYGYRRMCADDEIECYDALRIKNSWGEQWQREHDDGWVAAGEMLDSTGYRKGILSWLDFAGTDKGQRASR